MASDAWVGDPMGMVSPLTNELIEGHLVLDIECSEGIYLNGYVPKLRVGGTGEGGLFPPKTVISS